MFTFHTHPEVARAALREQVAQAPRSGIRRSARLISIEIRRSRRTEYTR